MPAVSARTVGALSAHQLPRRPSVWLPSSGKASVPERMLTLPEGVRREGKAEGEEAEEEPDPAHSTEGREL